MSHTPARYELALADVERVWADHLAAAAGGAWQRHHANRAAVRDLLAGLSTSGGASAPRLVIDQPAVLRWMVRYARGKAVGHVAPRLAVLSRFLKALRRAGLIDADLLAGLRAGPGRPSWPCLVGALQSGDPESALAALRPAGEPPGPLAAHVAPYIRLQQSLGKKYTAHGHVLRDLDRSLQAQAVPSPGAVTPALIERWLRPMRCIAAVRRARGDCARRFFDYLAGLGVVTGNPVAAALPGEGRWLSTAVKPFIFTREQLAAVLARARRLPDTHVFRCRAPTCATMLALLCALGLRHGEACRLRARDVDLDRQALFIGETKFHKSRYVPFGPKVGRCLQEFLPARRLVLAPLRDDDPLFVTAWRRPISPPTLLEVFRGLLQAEGIASGEGRPPRLHDLRHTFAVHRLLRWYRDGTDVQARLPALATFLGHVRPQSTQVYLSITAELLQEANARFQRHFGQPGRGGDRP